MRIRIKAFILHPNHGFTIKRIKGQQVFDYGDGLYANDKSGVYPIGRGVEVEPISIYRFHDPCAVGMDKPMSVAAHVWYTRVLEQLGGQRRTDRVKWFKWLVSGGVFAAAAYFIMG